MSGWELFTWVNVWILAGGSILVFLWFLSDLPDMRRRLGWDKKQGKDDKSRAQD